MEHRGHSAWRKQVGGVLASLLLLALCLGVFNIGNAHAASSGTFTFSDSGVSASDGAGGYKISGTELTINEAGTYTITGSCSEGNIKVKKATTGVTLILKDLSLSCSSTAPLAINKDNGDTSVQVVGTVTLVDNEDASLEDTSEDFEGAALKVKSGSNLVLGGTGVLVADGSNCKNGIKGGEGVTITIEEGITINATAANNGIASDNALVFNGGVINVTAGNDGIKSSPDDGDTVSAGTITINSGTFNITSAEDAIQAAGDLAIYGGVFTISAGDDGIKSEYTLTVGAVGGSGPQITIESCVEGLEGAIVNYNSGVTRITASDDGVNAANSDLGNYAFAINLAGGSIWVNSEGDALDSNGVINVTGGSYEVFGSSNDGNCAVDIAEVGGSWNVSGGSILAVGMSGMAITPTSGSYVAFGGGMGPGAAGSSLSVSAGQSLEIKDAGNNTVFSSTAVKKANSIVFASDSLQSGQKYTLYVNGKAVASSTAGAGSSQPGSAGAWQNRNQQGTQPGTENNGMPGGNGSWQPGQGNMPSQPRQNGDASWQPGQNGEWGQQGQQQPGSDQAPSWQAVIDDEENQESILASGKWSRVWGNSAYDTMASVVELGWTSSGGTVILATGENFPDALAAAGVAGLENAPIVTTATSGGVLSAQARAELKRLQPDTIIAVGGTYAMPQSVIDAAVSAAGGANAIRLWGEHASDTAAALNNAYASKWSDTALLATSLSFQDALSAAPLSYSLGMPIYLADDADSISDATYDSMARCGVKNVIVLGGVYCISDAVKDDLEAHGINVSATLAGTTAYDTSLAIASWGTQAGLKVDQMGVACSLDFSDALTGAALCGKNGAVLVLADARNYTTCLSLAKAHASDVESGYVFGGRYAVPNVVLEAFAQATK